LTQGIPWNAVNQVQQEEGKRNCRKKQKKKGEAV